MIAPAGSGAIISANGGAEVRARFAVAIHSDLHTALIEGAV